VCDCLSNYYTNVGLWIQQQIFIGNRFQVKFIRTFYKQLLTFKSTSVSVCFEESGDCHLLSSFCDDSNLHISLFKYALSTMGASKKSISKFLKGKSISRKITHRQSWKLQAKLTGEKLKGWSNSKEKTNSRLQSKFCNTRS